MTQLKHTRIVAADILKKSVEYVGVRTPQTAEETTPPPAIFRKASIRRESIEEKQSDKKRESSLVEAVYYGLLYSAVPEDYHVRFEAPNIHVAATRTINEVSRILETWPLEAQAVHKKPWYMNISLAVGFAKETEEVIFAYDISVMAKLESEAYVAIKNCSGMHHSQNPEFFGFTPSSLASRWEFVSNYTPM